MNSKLTLPCTTERLLIRDFNAGDRDSLSEFVHDPDQLKYMLFGLSTKKEIADFFKFIRDRKREKNRSEWHLALEEKGKPGCIGGVALMIEKDAPCSAELGYWLKRAKWGNGYATEAARFMLTVGFGTLGLHRIWGKCHSENTASAHVMEKLGMHFEGCVREHVWLRDHYRSSLLYSLLAQEYKGGK